MPLALTQIARVISLGVCLLFFSITAYADTTSGIEVTGQGSVDVIPDEFSVTVTVTERGRNVNKLRLIVDKKSNGVVSAAKSLNIKQSDISSARVNLRVIEEKPSIKVQGMELNNNKHSSVYINGHDINQRQKNNSPTKNLFELSRRITVNFNTIEEYDRFLTQVISLSVGQISSLSLSVKESDIYYQQALLAAIDQAKQKAQDMAKRASVVLNKVEYIKEMSSNHFRPVLADAMLSNNSNQSHHSLIGKQTVTARVLIKFSIEN